MIVEKGRLGPQWAQATPSAMPWHRLWKLPALPAQLPQLASLRCAILQSQALSPSWEDPLQILLGVIPFRAVFVRSSLLLPSSSLLAEGGQGTCSLLVPDPHCLSTWKFCLQVLEGHQPVDEAAAARLFAAMARLADSGQDSAPTADLAASMANLAVDYPPEVHACFLPAPLSSCTTCRSLLLGNRKGCCAASQ